MKTINLSICLLVLIANILFGVLLSGYSQFNCILTSVVIVLNTVFALLVSTIRLKDGFRVSLNAVFPVFFVLEMGLGAFAPERVKDNYLILCIFLLLLVQVSMAQVKSSVAA